MVLSFIRTICYNFKIIRETFPKDTYLLLDDVLFEVDDDEDFELFFEEELFLDWLFPDAVDFGAVPPDLVFTDFEELLLLPCEYWPELLLPAGKVIFLSDPELDIVLTLPLLLLPLPLPLPLSY
ncbi:MAG: hypothetical protein HZB98_04135 [Bacteroidia bacterium]|nr:hypothetical protein [Bacteroidia bacterium]